MNKEMTILIAEDDEGHAGLIKKNLKRAGIKNKTLLFKNGEEILNFLFSPDSIADAGKNDYLLMLDVRMPKVDGIEILRQIKENDILKFMPVIIFSTTDEPGTIKRCYDLGCTRYIIKPVDYEKFVEAVKELVDFLLSMKVNN